MTDLVAALRLQGDPSGAVAAAEKTKESLGGVTEAAAAAGEAGAAGLGNLSAGLERVTETSGTASGSLGEFLAIGRALDAELAQQAQTVEQLDRQIDALNYAYTQGVIDQEAYEASNARLTKQLGQMEAAAGRLADKYTADATAVQRLTADEVALNEALQSGLITQERYAAAMAGLTAERAALQATATELNRVAGASNAVTRELGIMTGEAIRGNYARLEGSTVTLANRTGLLSKVIATLAGPVGVLVGATGALVAAFASAEIEQYKFDKALEATGNSIGLTVGQLQAMSHEVGREESNFGGAADALAHLAASGKLTADELQSASQATVGLAELTGKSIDQIASQIEAIADNPVKAISAWNDRLHVLTLAEYEHIAALQEEGDKAGAASVAFGALADAVHRRTQQLQQDAGVVQRSWNGALGYISKTFHEFSESIGAIGASDSVKLAAAKYELASLEHLQAASAASVSKSIQLEIDAQKQRIAVLQQSVQGQEDAARAQADYEAVIAKGITAEQQIDKFLAEHADKASKLSSQLKDLTTNFLKVAAAEVATAAHDPFAGISNAIKGFASLGTGESIFGKLSAALADVDRASHGASTSIQGVATAQRAAEQAGTGLDDLIGRLSESTGPLARETAHYNAEIDTLAGYEAAFADAGKDSAAVLEKLQQALDLVNERHEKRIEILQAEQGLQQDNGDAVQRLLDRYSAEEAALSSDESGRRQANAELEAERQVRAAVKQAIEEGHPEYRAELEDLLNVARAHADYVQELNAERDLIRDWSQTAQQDIGNAFQQINRDIVQGGSVMHDLVDDAKQTVEQVMFEFEKLAFLNPLLNAVFGSSLPTFSTAQGAFGLLGGGGGGGGLLSGAAAFFGSGAAGSNASGNVLDVLTGGGSAGGGGFNGSGALLSFGQNASQQGSLLSPSSWIDAGRNLWSGFTQGSADAGSTWFGSWSGLGQGGSIGAYGTSGYGVNLPGGGTASVVPGAQGGGVYTPSTFGTAVGIAGGLYAGYNEFQAAGGGAAGIAGGLTYGIGTYAASAGIASLAAGGSFGAGIAGAAGLSAVPIIGWAALIAMGIDILSGGNLFGAAKKPWGSQETFSISSAGANVTAQEQWKKKQALFQGNTYSWSDIPVDQQTQDALASYFQSIENVLQKDASKLGKDASNVTADIVEGSFNETFDKNGKVQEQVSTILGQTFKESFQDFQQRELADSLLNLLPASQNAQQIAQQWQNSASDLLDGTQLLLAAQVDINHGMGLLGDADQSLSDVADVVVRLRQDGESLVQTYARLQAEQESLAGDLASIGVSISKTGADFVQFADDAATAAGGVQNLDALFGKFAQEYLTPAEAQADTIAALKRASSRALGAIGEDVGVTMAQFKQDFLAALPTLSGDELARWLQAADALYQYTNAVSTSADALVQAKQKYASFEIQLYGDQFISTFAQVVSAEEQQINTANQLAQAAGLAGASQRDLAQITTASSLQIGKALADLTVGIQNDITTLYGAQGQSAFLGSGDVLNLPAIQAQDAARQAAEKAQQQSVAYDLIQKLGDYAFASGGTVDDILKQYPVLDKLAQTLGVSADQVKQDIQIAEDEAASLTKMAAASDIQIGIQTDILDVLQGKPPSYDISSLGAPATSTASAGKPPTLPIGVLPIPGLLPTGQGQQTTPIATATAEHLAGAVAKGTAPQVTQQQITNALLTELIQKFSGIGGTPVVGGRRSTRPIFPGVTMPA